MSFVMQQTSRSNHLQEDDKIQTMGHNPYVLTFEKKEQEFISSLSK
jgi:hypothetical protein